MGLYSSPTSRWFRSGQKLSASCATTLQVLLVYRIPSPDLFIYVCVRKHKRRDLHVLADVDVNRSCENLGFDHLVFGYHARRFDGTYERKIDSRCKGYGVESARWLIERDGWDRAACSSRSRTSLVRILQLVVKDVAD
ncbi:unnamed protein product [Lasius platythorax]|uniref:Uncharacterized protein n=1 Tax=Lasius platythorax TaxID=488582 RepID=A0AAV2P1A3_9HYME